MNKGTCIDDHCTTNDKDKKCLEVETWKGMYGGPQLNQGCFITTSDNSGGRIVTGSYDRTSNLLRATYVSEINALPLNPTDMPDGVQSWCESIFTVPPPTLYQNENWYIGNPFFSADSKKSNSLKCNQLGQGLTDDDADVCKQCGNQLKPRDTFICNNTKKKCCFGDTTKYTTNMPMGSGEFTGDIIHGGNFQYGEYKNCIGLGIPHYNGGNNDVYPAATNDCGDGDICCYSDNGNSGKRLNNLTSNSVFNDVFKVWGNDKSSKKKLKYNSLENTINYNDSVTKTLIERWGYCPGSGPGFNKDSVIKLDKAAGNNNCSDLIDGLTPNARCSDSDSDSDLKCYNHTDLVECINIFYVSNKSTQTNPTVCSETPVPPPSLR